MKILLLLKFPLYGGGSGTYTRKLAEHLVKQKGYEVAIVAPDTRKLNGVKLFSVKLPFQAVFENHPEFKNAKKYRSLSPAEFQQIYQSFFQTIVATVEEFKPDVIHVQHASYLTWIASIIKSFYGIPFIVTEHGTGIYNTTLDNRFLILTKQALRRAEYIVCVSPYIKKWLLRVYGRDLQKKTRLIPGAVDLDFFDQPVKTDQLEKKYQLNGQPLVLFAGRLTKEKGVIYLLRAAKNINGQVLIIGDGEERTSLEAFVAKKRLKNVRFLGYFGRQAVDQLRALYQRATVLVVPSVCDEALPLVILEAMAAETPVVASIKGGIPLVVKDGQTGFLVRAGSAKAIEASVNELIAKPALQQRLGRNAKQMVIARFSWPILTEEIAKLYQRASSTKNSIVTKQPVGFLDSTDRAREKKELAQHKVEST